MVGVEQVDEHPEVAGEQVLHEGHDGYPADETLVGQLMHHGVPFHRLAHQEEALPVHAEDELAFGHEPPQELEGALQRRGAVRMPVGVKPCPLDRFMQLDQCLGQEAGALGRRYELQQFLVRSSQPGLP